jgi:hypothetical protein
MTYRYAVYYVPELQSDFYALGSSLLGYSIREGGRIHYPVLPGVKSVGEFTRKAAVYGFHATIVAPFQTEASREAICSGLEKAVEGHAPFRLNKLEMTLLRGFPVLLTSEPMEALSRLEQSLLETLSPMFLPPDPASLQRRGGLSPRQLEYFWKWGYPFVLDEHCFHLTLGDSEAPDYFLTALKGYFPEGMLEKLTLSKVSLCIQEKKEGPFVVDRDFPLG